MTDWTAIYRTSDGVLLGCGTVLPDTLPAGTSTKVYPGRPDQGTRWDPATRDFVAIPPPVLVDRLADLANHPYLATMWGQLNATQRQRLRRAMVWVLGARRYREPGEDVAIEPPNGWPADPSTVTE